MRSHVSQQQSQRIRLEMCRDLLAGCAGQEVLICATARNADLLERVFTDEDDVTGYLTAQLTRAVEELFDVFPAAHRGVYASSDELVAAVSGGRASLLDGRWHDGAIVQRVPVQAWMSSETLGVEVLGILYRDEGEPALYTVTVRHGGEVFTCHIHDEKWMRKAPSAYDGPRSVPRGRGRQPGPARSREAPTAVALVLAGIAPER